MDRKLLVVGVFAVAAMVALSGCTGGGDSADADIIEFVPNENVDGVFHVDMAILEDQTTQDLTNTLIEMQMENNPGYDGPESYDEIWNEFNQSSGTDFDPRDLNEIVVFTAVPEDTDMEQNESLGAAILSADLTEDEMVSLIEQNATVEAGEYNGVPFYTVESETEFGETQTNYMAVLQEGVYSFGQEGPVRNTVDVSQGDADALSGELREELDRVRDGYINFAVSIPEDAFNNTIGSGPTTPGGPGQQFGAFREISVVSGSYYTEGDTMGLSANMRTGSAEDAEGISDAIGGLTFLASDYLGENASAILDPIETETDGSTVIVTYETTVDELVENAEAFQEYLGSPGPGTPSENRPSAGVSFTRERGSFRMVVVDPGNLDSLRLQGPAPELYASAEIEDPEAGMTIEVRRGGYPEEEVQGDLIAPNEDECRVGVSSNLADRLGVSPTADIPCDGAGIEGLDGEDVRYEAGAEYQLIGVVDGTEVVIQTFTTEAP